MIRDLDASKGSTKVNGQAVPEKGTVLRPGDVLAIGKTKIVVCNDRYTALSRCTHTHTHPLTLVDQQLTDRVLDRLHSVDKPNKFLPEDHSATVSPPGSYSSNMPFTSSVPTGFAAQSAPALMYPAGGGSSSGGMSSVLSPPPALITPGAPMSIHHAAPVVGYQPAPPIYSVPAPVPADVDRTGAQSPAPAEQWNDDDLDEVEHEQEREDEYAEEEEDDGHDGAYGADHNAADDGGSYDTWDDESGRRRGSSIRKEEIDSLAATLKGLGLATTDNDSTADAANGDYQVSSTSSLPASAVPS
jgi:hypothetical protein